MTSQDVSLAHLEESRSISQSLQTSLTGSLAMAQGNQETWRGLKHDLDDERSELESRKAGRSRGALTSVFSVLTHCKYYNSHSFASASKFPTLIHRYRSDIFPDPLDYPLIRLITTSIGRYPSILPVLQASKMIVHLAFDGMYWMFWITVSPTCPTECIHQRRDD
jgi:hypothetical protein